MSNPYASPQRGHFYLAGVFTGITVAAVLVVLAGRLGYLPDRAEAAPTPSRSTSSSPSPAGGRQVGFEFTGTTTDAVAAWSGGKHLTWRIRGVRLDRNLAEQGSDSQQTWSWPHHAGDQVWLTVRNKTDRGRVECSLWVDDVLVSHDIGRRSARCAATVKAGLSG